MFHSRARIYAPFPSQLAKGVKADYLPRDEAEWENIGAFARLSLTPGEVDTHSAALRDAIPKAAIELRRDHEKALTQTLKSAVLGVGAFGRVPGVRMHWHEEQLSGFVDGPAHRKAVADVVGAVLRDGAMYLLN